MDPTLAEVGHDLEIGGLTSAQRDKVIYLAVLQLKEDFAHLSTRVADHHTQHDREIYGDPNTREEGMKAVVIRIRTYIDEQRQSIRTLKAVAQFLGLANIAGWVALAAILFSG